MHSFTFNKIQIGKIIEQVTNIAPRTIDVLEAIKQHLTSKEELEALSEEKIATLVGEQYEHKINGVTFENESGEKRQDIIKKMIIGEKIVFEWQPSHEQDPHAVAVRRLDTSQIGFLPKNAAKSIYDVADKLEGVVDMIVGGEDGKKENLGVRFHFIRKGIVNVVNLDMVDLYVDQMKPESKNAAEKEVEKIVASVNKRATDNNEEDIF